MKNLYPKGKGKIHPSPSAPPTDGGGASSSSSYDVLAVLKLLPAAILSLTAALSYEDKEVLAYLITRSIHGTAVAAAAVVPGRRRLGVGVAHRPLFDCGCFDCYTSFWSRWDSSPDRELIHQVIEAFEEHLASSEKKGGRGRRRERRAGDRAEKGKVEEQQKDGRKAVEAEAVVVEEKSEGGEAAGLSGDVREASDATDSAAEVGGKEGNGEEEAVAVGGERRRGWPDVMGLFNSRFWSLWGPAV